MKYKEGEKVWADVGALRNKWKRKIWRRGVIKKVYDSWYLVDMGKYRIGVKEQDMKRRLSKRDYEKSEVER